MSGAPSARPGLADAPVETVVVSETQTISTTVSITTSLPVSTPPPLSSISSSNVATSVPFDRGDPSTSVRETGQDSFGGAPGPSTATGEIFTFSTELDSFTADFETSSATFPTDTLPPSSSSELAGMVVSTVVSAQTDGQGVVHTFTEVTTIASFRAIPTSKNTKGDMRDTTGSSSSPPNIGVIVAAVMGSLAACAVGLLLIYWCKRSRRRKFEFDYTESHGPLPTGVVWPFVRQPHTRLNSEPSPADRATIGSFGNSQEMLTIRTGGSYLETATTNIQAPSSTVDLSPAQPAASSSDNLDVSLEGQARPRKREGLVQRERPPTYVTNTTGIATIATNGTHGTALPQYSAYDPSPISERSEFSDFLNTPTSSSTPTSPVYGRDKYRRPIRYPHNYPLTPIGEKF
ncbi:hypothetical protein NP233_g11457 [Leucocoprinus birnbaumii]|uniref:Uncharacterized protein n=1 Tax=Leucocoprinus birnbaumii TaxID=56174 RepID=A0AAD5YNY8_9AGAR|nr:hypothetical protein NP233_g11457 [Leucocoprinus birnbaumii]